MPTDLRKISFVFLRLLILLLTLMIAQLSLKDDNILVSYTTPTNMLMMGIILYSIIYTIFALLSKDEFFVIIIVIDAAALIAIALLAPALSFVLFIPLVYYTYVSALYKNAGGYLSFFVSLAALAYILVFNNSLLPQLIAIALILALALSAQFHLKSIIELNKKLDADINKVKKENTKLENSMLISEKNARTQKELATIDYLTGLMNRSAFLRTLEQFLDNTYANDIKVGLLLMDIDHFKKYNDTYGHAIGDETLKVVSKILRDSANFMGDETNVVARYGGEEMIIAVPNTTLDKLTKLAETVRRAIESQSINLIKINTQLILEKPITLSVGAVIWGKEDQGVDVSKDSDILINRADEALYQAKANGRNQVVMYSPKI